MAEEAIINSVRRYLNHLKDNGFNVSFGILFGSQVTGTATELSDIDLVVVSPDFDKRLNAGLWTNSGRLQAGPITELSRFPAASNDGRRTTTPPSSTSHVTKERL